jgi:hypothetical protein
MSPMLAPGRRHTRLFKVLISRVEVSRYIGVVHSAAWREPPRYGAHKSIDSITVSPNSRNASAEYDADALSQQSAVAEEHGGLQ